MVKFENDSTSKTPKKKENKRVMKLRWQSNHRYIIQVEIFNEMVTNLDPYLAKFPVRYRPYGDISIKFHISA